jgi:hypothetical protein
MKFTEWKENRNVLSDIEKKLDILEEQMGMPGGVAPTIGAKTGASKAISTVVDDIKRMFSKVTNSSGVKNVFNSVTKRFNDLINKAKTPGEVAQLANQKVQVSQALSNAPQKSGGL